jgi:hypothetical protein
MDKNQKAELERIQKELVDAHNKAAWQMAATIIKASLVKNGMDQPPTPAELADLNATITNLRSVAEDALELLKRRALSHSPGLHPPRQGFPPASSGLNAALLLPRFLCFPNLPCLSQRVASDRTALLSRCSVRRPN